MYALVGKITGNLCVQLISEGVQGGSVAGLCGYDTKVCGFDSQPAPLACCSQPAPLACCSQPAPLVCLFVKKVQLLKPHNVYVKIVHDLHEFRGPLVE